MLPPFDDDGLLPTGIHIATIAEVEARFGLESEARRVQMESLHWLIDLARRVGAIRLVINGSFVTDVYEPNDVDCVLLIDETFPTDPALEKELIAGLPFLDIEIAEQVGFDDVVNSLFSTDRFHRRKGMVEIIL